MVSRQALPAMRETTPSSGREDSLEKGKAPHSQHSHRRIAMDRAGPTGLEELHNDFTSTSHGALRIRQRRSSLAANTGGGGAIHTKLAKYDQISMRKGFVLSKESPPGSENVSRSYSAPSPSGHRIIRSWPVSGRTLLRLRRVRGGHQGPEKGSQLKERRRASTESIISKSTQNACS